MKVWRASFDLSQERLIFLFLTGLGVTCVGYLVALVVVHLSPIGEDAEPWFAFLPSAIRIGVWLTWAGLMLLALWVPLSIATTVAIRLRIRRENYVRPKS